jgi:hypothetical protein
LKIEIKNYSAKLERATGIEPVLPTWESELSTLYFQHLQSRSGKMYVHALHTVHAVPDLRIAAGRFAGRFSRKLWNHFGEVFGDRQRTLTAPEKTRAAAG